MFTRRYMFRWMLHNNENNVIVFTFHRAISTTARKCYNQSFCELRLM